LNRKLAILLILSFTFVILPSHLVCAYPNTKNESIKGSLNLWGIAEEILYSGSNQESLNSSGRDPLFSFFNFKNGIIDTPLPGGSHLKVKGRKVIGIKHTQFNYLEPQAEEDKPTSTTEIEQELQIQARGRIGEKIFVNVDYDDTAPRTEQQKISLIYKGDEHEVIKEAAVGDITLALPKTHFTSYNKSLFGVRVKARWRDFYLIGIGSTTKGVSDVKTFTGKTTTQEEEISDTSYIRRTYFKVFFDQTYPPEDGFSYTPGSLEVWIDDQDGTNNISGQTVHMSVIGEQVDGITDSYEGYFDRQYSGQDYTVDALKGVLKFNKQIGENYVIALAYKDANGDRHPNDTDYYMIMKGADERYFKYRFWNYYYLGSQRISQDGFIFQIQDLSGNIIYDWESPENYPAYEVNVDFDFGIAQIFKPPTSSTTYYYPFFSEDELPTPSHRYTIYTKYSRSVDIYLLHPDIVPGSERVYVDGKLLKKDEDYTIDYASGYLSFLNPELISPDTKIRVEYEWMPLMGGQATLLGGRFEYRPNDDFSIGSTFLSQAAPSAGRIPSLGSSPAFHQVWEADLNFNIKPNLGSLWGGDFPVGVLFAGEISKSNVNPNSFGAAMLEDFSTSRLEDTLPLGKDSWRLGSIPSGVDPVQRDNLTISDEEVKGEEVNPSWSSDEITTLTLSYNFTPGPSWDSATCSLSNVGKNYTQMRYLEVWCKGITGDIEVYLDIGIVSEDADGDGTLDTEDENGDGILNPGEDTGIMIGDRLIGAGNGKLDTEDLDGDGILDTDENFSSYSLSDEYKKQVPDTGWCKYTVPLNTAANWDIVKGLVKHIRIWAKGSNFSGEIKFAKIGILGDRWQVDNIEIKDVSSYDDIYEGFPDPFDSPDFRGYYEKMFGNTKTSEGKWQKESFLRLTPTIGEEGYIQQTFISNKNFSNYRQVNFWVYVEGDGGREGELYLKFGSDVETNYYEYTLPLSSVSTERWIKVEVIYINDVYLNKVYEQKGQAQRYFIKGDFSKYFTLSAEYKKIEPPFSVIGASSTNQFSEFRKWGMSSSYFNFLPFSYSRSEEYTSTQTVEGTNLAPTEKDRVLKKSQNYRLGLKLSYWPTLSFKGSNTSSFYLSKEPEEITFEDTYDLSLNYSVPGDSPFLPTDISTSFQLKKTGKKIEGEPTSMDVTKKGSINLPFHPLPNLVLKTSYSQSETDYFEDEVEKAPKSRSKDLSLSSRFSIFNLTPRIELKGGHTEESFSSGEPGKRKVSTRFNASYALPLRPASFIKVPEVFSTVGWYLSFGVKKEGIYENTSTLLDFSSQFGLGRLDLLDGREKLWLEKRTFNLKQSWRPTSFLTTSLSYGKEEEDKIEYGTPYKVRGKAWPVAELKFDLNKTPFVDRFSQKFFPSSNLVFGYSEKTTIKENISTTKVFQPSLSWKGTFKKPENLSLVYSYNSTAKRERPFGSELSSEEFSSTHKLKLNWSGYIPWGARVPLLGQIINFKNRVNLSTNLTRELNYKEAVSSVVQENKEKWTLGMGISYKMSDNINMRLGLDLTWYQDKIKVGEDYFSYTGSARVEILF